MKRFPRLAHNQETAGSAPVPASIHQTYISALLRIASLCASLRHVSLPHTSDERFRPERLRQLEGVVVPLVQPAIAEPEPNRCGSCVYWEDNTEWDPPDLYDEHGSVITKPGDSWEAVIAPGRWGECKMPDFMGPTLDSLAYVKDGSGYTASLNTRTDFGCVLWKAREAHG